MGQMEHLQVLARTELPHSGHPSVFKPLHQPHAGVKRSAIQASGPETAPQLHVVPQGTVGTEYLGTSQSVAN